MATSAQRKRALAKLIAHYQKLTGGGVLDDSTEETARAWINRLLEIFEWDPKDPTQVVQEESLSEVERKKLKEIDSSHRIPDYGLTKGKNILTFLDAKRLAVDLESDKQASFQIRSYGWSAGLMCSFTSNFRQLAVYDCRPKPDKDDSSDQARVHFLRVENYLENFDLLEGLLLRENVQTGALDKIISGVPRLQGAKSLDEDFAERLSSFRKQLARHLWQKNRALLEPDPHQLGYLTLIILDRIIFIRVAEAKGLEREGLLKEFCQAGFWAAFRKASRLEFLEKYDGPLFAKDPTTIAKLDLDDRIFETFIEGLYYPAPYRFDVIPVKLLGDVYERFLGEEIVVRGSGVVGRTRPDLRKAGGAVTTPLYMVQAVCRRTLEPLLKRAASIDDVLSLRVLDPACGSGTFLSVIFDVFEEKIIGIAKKRIPTKYRGWFIRVGEELLLTTTAKREIINRCIFGTDISPEAVEVARMSLALKLLENAERHENIHHKMGLTGRMILEGLGQNIRPGNYVVDEDVFKLMPGLQDAKPSELIALRPFSFLEKFPQIFRGGAGFDAIIGNPPYVEAKWLAEFNPIQHSYLKQRYLSCRSGKIDVSIPFIERSLDLLGPKGRLGFIVQKRFFKTEYGAALRGILSEKKSVSEIIDFKSTCIFEDELTYVALMILSKAKNESFDLIALTDDPPMLASRLLASGLRGARIKSKTLTSGPWIFGSPALLALKAKLEDRLGTLKQLPGLEIGVGLQVLWNRVYHIKPEAVRKGIVHGSNGLKEAVRIEEAACKPIMANVKFCAFRPAKADVFGIFPYEIRDGKARKIAFSDFKKRFPLAGKYLEQARPALENNVEMVAEREFWHTYTREQNLVRQRGAQVLVPMTATDTFASVDRGGDLYCDNVNVNFLKISQGTEVSHLALAAIINSTTFSVLGRMVANEQAGGNFKFNRQFLWPIPFPCAQFTSHPELLIKIAGVANRIVSGNKLLVGTAEHNADPIRARLRHDLGELDSLVADLYQLTPSERNLVEDESRANDRTKI